MYNRNLSLRLKILGGYGAMVALAVLLGVLMLNSTRKIGTEYDRLANDTVAMMLALEQVRASGFKVIGDSRDVVTLQMSADVFAGRSPAAGTADRKKHVTARDIREANARLQRAITEYREAWSVYKSLVERIRSEHGDTHDTLFTARLQAVGNRLIELALMQSKMIAQGHGRQFDEQLIQFHDELRKQTERIKLQERAFVTLVDDVIKSETGALREHQAGVAATIGSARLNAGIVAGIAIVLGLGLGWALSGRIARRVYRLLDATREVAAGRMDLGTADGTRDELGELSRSFRDMTLQLRSATDRLGQQQRLATLGQVAGTVSHELRNPLAAISASLATVRYLMADKNLGVERALERIDRGVQRCTRIIKELLSFTNGDELLRLPTPIDEWLVQLLSRHELPNRDRIELRLELRAACDVDVDDRRLSEVLINILDNAAQALFDPTFVPPPGHVRAIVVRTEVAGPHLRLSVADTGPGIAADILPRIFDPLFTTKSFGVGLGLSTARQVVEQHGGTIDVESAPGNGTTFTIWLPRRAPSPGVLPAPNNAETRAA